jgi:hypothetical protein
MIKLISFGFLFYFISCSTGTKKPLPFKSIPAENQVQARSIIQNHLNFLNLLFEQSKDPYYNVPKWTPECLEENKIGKLNENGKDMQAISILYVNDLKEVGQCSRSERTYPAYVIYVYCEKSHEVREIKYVVGTQKDPKSLNLCE